MSAEINAALQIRRRTALIEELVMIHNRCELTVDQLPDDQRDAEKATNLRISEGLRVMHGVDPWISCKDRLPDAYETMLLFCPDAVEQVWIGRYEDTGWVGPDGNWIREEVTHWMRPLAGPSKAAVIADETKEAA